MCKCHRSKIVILITKKHCFGVLSYSTVATGTIAGGNDAVVDIPAATSAAAAYMARASAGSPNRTSPDVTAADAASESSRCGRAMGHLAGTETNAAPIPPVNVQFAPAARRQAAMYSAMLKCDRGNSQERTSQPILGLS